jgi:PKD repeat protein
VSSDPDGSVVTWSWDFGDGTTSNDQNPSHSYTNDGTYTVTLTVWDDCGSSNSVSEVIVVENLAPLAGFSFLPSNPRVLQDVIFVDESSDPDGSVVAWSWEFGDGATSNEQNPTHSYSSEGTYTVTLMVWDEDGDSKTISKTIIVKNESPVAEFSMTPENPKIGELVTLTDKSSDPDGSIVEWEWDFGDGTTSSEQNPSHRYLTPGTYTIHLKVYDDSGDFSLYSKEITVEPNEVVPDEVYHFPWWLLVLIVAVILFLILFIILLRRRKKKEEEIEEMKNH